MIVILAVLVTVLTLGLIVYLLLTGRLREKYAVMWVGIGALVLLLGLFPQLLVWMTELLGVELPSNLLFALAIFLLLGVCLHLSWELSRLENEGRRLAEEMALAQARIDALEARAARTNN